MTKVYIYTVNNKEPHTLWTMKLYSSMEKALLANPHKWEVNEDRTQAWTVGPEHIIEKEVL